MTTAIPFGTRLIGQTEKTLNAILDRLLSGSGVTEHQWVALTVTLQQGATPAAAAAQRIATTLQLPLEAGAEVLTSLIESGFAEIADADTVAASTAGQEFHERIHQQISQVTARLWGDIPADERDTAAAVLNTTLQRATAELAALTP
ncbi:MAG: MarR family transcriptional regulator [Aldersonia sp.]|nr:MarR family transcriptional regulator [Aldersonia sp.]